MKQGLPLYNVLVLNDQLGETVPLTVNSVSSTVTFNNVSSARNYDVMVTSISGNATCFIGFGLKANGVTATLPGTTGTTVSTPVLAGAIYNFQKNTDSSMNDTCAAICAGTGTATLYFTSVQGS
jgi:hypothetical protein